jgi:diguanylate cyclase (GGDEF)-like protein
MVTATCAASAVFVVLLRVLNARTFPVGDHSWIWLATTLYLIGQAIWAHRRGRRVSDPAFMVAMILALVVAAVFVADSTPPGTMSSIELGLLCPTILATLFCPRRWQVAFVVTVACALMGYLTQRRVGAGSFGDPAVLVALFTVLLVVVVVRLLHEQSEEALIRASRGEVTDPLTGLANRRGLERYAPDAWDRGARVHASISLLVVDIDHFKRVNDTLGHAAGDELIVRVAQLLSASLRRDDLAVRLGGEEFLILSQVSQEQALVIAERLRATIEEQLAPVTVSIGVHTARPETGDDLSMSLWRAVDVADQALYVAKRSGRNQVQTVPASGEEPARA